MKNDFEDVTGSVPHEDHHDIPLGWWAIFWGLILFGVVYAWLYIPAFSGWSQESAYEQSLLEGGKGN